jgi:hypothetical protein
MVRRLFTLIVVLAGSVAVAQPIDPLNSADCRQALKTLQAQEDAALAAPQAGRQSGGLRRSPDARLETLRRHAALVCLGGRADSPPPAQRFAQPPVVVPPVAMARPVQQLALPTLPTVPAPKHVEPPVVTTSCDPLGCWASDGSRLNRVGQNLLGPRGLCGVQGTLLQCP